MEVGLLLACLRVARTVGVYGKGLCIEGRGSKAKRVWGLVDFDLWAGEKGRQRMRFRQTDG